MFVVIECFRHLLFVPLSTAYSWHSIWVCHDYGLLLFHVSLLPGCTNITLSSCKWHYLLRFTVYLLNLLLSVDGRHWESRWWLLVHICYNCWTILQTSLRLLIVSSQREVLLLNLWLIAILSELISTASSLFLHWEWIHSLTRRLVQTFVERTLILRSALFNAIKVWLLSLILLGWIVLSLWSLEILHSL